MVPRLVAALTRHTDSIVLVVHNIHEVHDNEARDALDLLVDHLPAHVQLVVSSRQPVWLASPARRARGDVLELGPSDLAFTGEEVTRLLELTPGAPLPNELADIMSSTEGWPAGVYLSSLALRRHRSNVSSRPAPGHCGDQLSGDRRLRQRRSAVEAAARHRPVPAHGHRSST